MINTICLSDRVKAAISVRRPSQNIRLFYQNNTESIYPSDLKKSKTKLYVAGAKNAFLPLHLIGWKIGETEGSERKIEEEQ